MFRFLESFCSDLTYLDTDYFFTGEMCPALGRCSQLTTLILRNFIGNIEYIPEPWKVNKLKKLLVDGVMRRNDFILELVTYNPNLEDLTLGPVDECLIKISEKCPNLRALSVCDCDQLHDVELPIDHQNLTKDVCQRFLSNLPKLEKLSITYCNKSSWTSIEVSFYFK